MPCCACFAATQNVQTWQCNYANYVRRNWTASLYVALFCKAILFTMTCRLEQELAELKVLMKTMHGAVKESTVVCDSLHPVSMCSCCHGCICWSVFTVFTSKLGFHFHLIGFRETLCLLACRCSKPAESTRCVQAKSEQLLHDPNLPRLEKERLLATVRLLF